MGGGLTNYFIPITPPLAKNPKPRVILLGLVTFGPDIASLSYFASPNPLVKRGEGPVRVGEFRYRDGPLQLLVIKAAIWKGSAPGQSHGNNSFNWFQFSSLKQ